MHTEAETVGQAFGSPGDIHDSERSDVYKKGTLILAYLLPGRIVQQCKSNGVSKSDVSFDKGALRAHSLYPFCMTDEAIRTGARRRYWLR